MRTQRNSKQGRSSRTLPSSAPSSCGVACRGGGERRRPTAPPACACVSSWSSATPSPCPPVPSGSRRQTGKRPAWNGERRHGHVFPTFTLTTGRNFFPRFFLNFDQLAVQRQGNDLLRNAIFWGTHYNTECFFLIRCGYCISKDAEHQMLFNFI